MAANVRLKWIQNALVTVVVVSNFYRVSANKAKLLGGESFRPFLLNKDDRYFVMFYAPWCGHCMRMQSLWDQLAERTHTVGQSLTIGKLDCTEHTQLCATEDIKAYPTLKLFVGKDKYTYRGNRNLNDLEDFVNSRVSGVAGTADYVSPDAPEPDHGISAAAQLNEEAFNEAIRRQSFTFVDFFAPWCPHCVDLAPVWDELASHYKFSSVTIAKIDCTSEPMLCKAQSIGAYPTLRLFRNGVTVEDYRGSRDFHHLVAFLEAHHERSEKEAARENQMGAASVEPAQIETSHDYDSFLPLSDDELTAVVNAEEVWLTWQLYHRLRPMKSLVVYFHSDISDDSVRLLPMFKKFAAQLRLSQLDVIPAMINCLDEKELCIMLTATRYPAVHLIVDRRISLVFPGPVFDELQLMEFVKRRYRLNLKKDEL